MQPGAGWPDKEDNFGAFGRSDCTIQFIILQDLSSDGCWHWCGRGYWAPSTCIRPAVEWRIHEKAVKNDAGLIVWIENRNRGFWKRLVTSVVSVNGAHLTFVFMVTESKLLQSRRLRERIWHISEKCSVRKRVKLEGFAFLYAAHFYFVSS